MLLPVKLWAATYSTGAHSNWLYVTCRKHVTAKESQTFTKHMFRNFSQELADQTRANTLVTIGLAVWQGATNRSPVVSLACEMFNFVHQYLFVVQEAYSNQCVWSRGLRFAAQYFIWTRFVFLRFVATFNNEITVIEICIGLWSRPLILSGIGSPFTLLLVFQFSVEYKRFKKKLSILPPNVCNLMLMFWKIVFSIQGFHWQ